MRIPIAAGNWKMNFGPRQAAEFARIVRDPLASITGAEVVLFPPFVSLDAVRQATAGTSIQLGAQNCSDQPGGAFTGEISPGMVAELGQWVILGHSERRHYDGETDALVQRKLVAALGAGLRTIACVGERLEDRDAGLTERVVSAQVRGSLGGLPSDALGRLAIAYEPVWAIGTGRAATRQDAEDVIVLIRALVSELYGSSVADVTRILYGGSVTAANIDDFMASPQIDGALVGGASIRLEFIDIARSIAAARQP
jgi:triosephosphate isomerase